MNILNQDPKIRRARRTRLKLRANLSIPRLSVFRSNQHLWAQIIDDRHAITLVSSSTKVIKAKGTKTEKSHLLGLEMAKLALANKISRVRFDRGPYKFHGRIKSLATGAREAGLKI